MWNAIVKFIADNKQNAEQKQNVEYAELLLKQRNTSGGRIIEKDMEDFVENDYKIPS